MCGKQTLQQKLKDNNYDNKTEVEKRNITTILCVCDFCV
jgi:hypothetical protein